MIQSVFHYDHELEALTVLKFHLNREITVRKVLLRLFFIGGVHDLIILDNNAFLVNCTYCEQKSVFTVIVLSRNLTFVY